MLTCVMMTDRMLTCVMMIDRITQFVSLMRLVNFFLSAFLPHKLCSQLYISLQVKNQNMTPVYRVITCNWWSV